MIKRATESATLRNQGVSLCTIIAIEPDEHFRVFVLAVSV